MKISDKKTVFVRLDITDRFFRNSLYLNKGFVCVICIIRSIVRNSPVYVEAIVPFPSSRSGHSGRIINEFSFLSSVNNAQKWPNIVQSIGLHCTNLTKAEHETNIHIFTLISTIYTRLHQYSFHSIFIIFMIS